MSYSVAFSRRAAKTIEDLPVSLALRIKQATDALAEDPRPPGCRKLRGADDLCRIRVGAYRVIYQVKDEVLLVLVLRVGHRREVYRGL